MKITKKEAKLVDSEHNFDIVEKVKQETDNLGAIKSEIQSLFQKFAYKQDSDSDPLLEKVSEIVQKEEPSDVHKIRFKNTLIKAVVPKVVSVLQEILSSLSVKRPELVVQISDNYEKENNQQVSISALALREALLENLIIDFKIAKDLIFEKPKVIDSDEGGISSATSQSDYKMALAPIFDCKKTPSI